MREFVDKTLVSPGTKITRDAMMAVQGFDTITTTFNNDRSITQTNSNNQTLTIVFNSDGTVTETFVGEKTIRKDISFTATSVVESINNTQPI